MSYAALGQIEQALQSFREAVNVRPIHLNSQLALGIINLRLRQYDKALKRYKIAASLNPDDSQLRQIIMQLEPLASVGNDAR